MVRLNVDAVIVVTTPAAMAVRNETMTVPIVHPAAIDPVGTGLIASLAHPGGNVTGLAVLNAETSAKRVELLQEVIPGLSNGAVLWNSANPANSLAWRETESAGRKLGVNLKSQEVRSPKDFEGAFFGDVRATPRRSARRARCADTRVSKGSSTSHYATSCQAGLSERSGLRKVDCCPMATVFPRGIDALPISLTRF
jgi:hypothetical protein